MAFTWRGSELSQLQFQCFSEWAPWGGVCWYGEIYWNANLSSYLLFKGENASTPSTPSNNRPPLSPLLHKSVAPVASQEAAEGRPQGGWVFSVSLKWSNDLSSSGEVPVWNPPTGVDWRGGGAGIADWWIGSSFLFCPPPLLSLSRPCLPSGLMQMDSVPVAFRPRLPRFVLNCLTQASLLLFDFYLLHKWYMSGIQTFKDFFYIMRIEIYCTVVQNWDNAWVQMSLNQSWEIWESISGNWSNPNRKPESVLNQISWPLDR